MDYKKILILYAIMALFAFLGQYMFDGTVYETSKDLNAFDDSLLSGVFSFSSGEINLTSTSQDMLANSDVSNALSVEVQQPDGITASIQGFFDSIGIIGDILELLANLAIAPISLIFASGMPLYIRLLIGTPLLIMGFLGIRDLFKG